MVGMRFHIVNRVLDEAIALAVKSFATQSAFEIQKRRDQYLAFVAHDLRTPLNAVALAARVLDRFVPSDPPDAPARRMVRALNRILAAGLTRARAIAAWQVAESARTALADAMTESDVVVGWRRATSGAPCGACLAAATGAILDTEDVPEAHTNCQCVAEPVIRGVRDLHPRPTGEEIFDSLTAEQQDALFAGRGGAEKARLIRSGTPLSALITRSTMAAQADQITETPLAALR